MITAAEADGVKREGDRGNLANDNVKGRVASLRVRQAQAARRRVELAPIIAEIRASGATTLQQIADGLNARGIPTAWGRKWAPTQVSRVEAGMA